ncbi:MAG: hypothetical protein JWR26_1526 [Pedosphaera sp.]|nr:hypothetical protein [Pedosphaera sp.]
MPNKSVFCIAQKDSQAVDIIQQLKTAGFHHEDISVLFPDKQGTRDFAHEHETKAPEGAVTGAGTGGVLGGALGWLTGIGALSIPGVGPFVAAGPLLAALSGVAVGAAVGGITGALVGMGIPEYEAKRYEGKIQSGNILISVHSETSGAADKAKAIFKRVGAQDISSAGEETVKARASKGRKEAEPVAVESKRSAEKMNPQTTPQAGEKPQDTGAASGSKRSRPPAPTTTAQTGTRGEPTWEEISARAYQNYLKQGRPEGRDVEIWLESEAQLKAERRRTAKPSER